MRLEYEHTFEDKLALDRARRSIWARLPGYILFAIFGGLFLGAGVLGYRSGVVEGWWVLPAVFASIAIAGPFITRWEKRRAWRKSVGVVPPRLVVAIAQEGILIDAGAERAFLEWRAFTHYRETKELFLLYQGPGWMRYFPKRAFGGEEGVKWFRQALAEKVVRTKYVPETPAFPVVPRPAEPAGAQPPAPEVTSR